MLGNSSRNSHHGADLAATHTSLVFIVFLYLFSFVQSARTDIIWSGDLDPDDPTTWTSNTHGYVGYTSAGSIKVDEDSDLQSFYGYIGMNDSATGTVTITGSGSTWSNTASLIIGGAGNGTLEISDGGYVNTGSEMYQGNSSIGIGDGSSGKVMVSGNGSTWSNGGDLNVGGGGIGTLEVTNGAYVRSHISTIGFNSGSTGIATVSGTDSTWDNTQLKVGISGDGMLTITNGGIVDSGSGTIGSTGLVTVNGTGAIWKNNVYLRVATYGTLEVTNGGYARIEKDSYIYGNVIISGDGSYMTTIQDLFIGNSNHGTLTITDGGMFRSLKDSFVAKDVGSTGEITVSGVGSKLLADHFNIGSSGNGTLTITDGGTGEIGNLRIGSAEGSTGLVSVSDSGSTLVSDRLRIGYYGNGTLQINNGGAVVVPGLTYVAERTTSEGEIAFGLGGGTFSTRSLFFSPEQITGTGIVNANGLVGDIDLIFDADNGLTQAFCFNSEPDQSITLNLDMCNPDDVGCLGAGWKGQGTMIIKDGITVESNDGSIGFRPEAIGEVTVSGSNSAWINRALYVGRFGSGTLTIADGGSVSSLHDYHASSIGVNSGSTGHVTVNGLCSTWSISYDLYVGNQGSGMLNITNDGLVSVANTLTIDTNADGDSFINMSTGGMLALHGQAGGSIAEFLELVEGTDAIRYWDYSISDWANILGATQGQDYLLEYMSGGDLAGYTVLTVMAVPEPSILYGLLGLCLTVFLGKRRAQQRK
ncbi:MAG: PEP-CTERM sorting domain-containing protein [Pirellulales bacterium]|nr:PEP-CTERM sorting domain-containing protein [Pirellulales bacterium]